jgi:hypothetical protein
MSAAPSRPSRRLVAAGVKRGSGPLIVEQLSPGDVYVAAALADHRAHCTSCRSRHEDAEARYAEYGESIRRRDRIQLGLHIASTPAR